MKYEDVIKELGNCRGHAKALKIAAECVKRQIPQKPTPKRYGFECPSCGNSLISYIWQGGIHYCDFCGISVDWGEGL